MARRGRPRKPGKRKPCGRRSDSVVHAEQKKNDVRNVVFEQPHRRWLEASHRRDQRAESEIGRLLLAGKITEAQYWAADRWRAIVMQFHIVLATPMNTGTALGRVVAAPVDEDAWKRGESGKNERTETEEEMRDRVLRQHGAVMNRMREMKDGPVISAVLESVILADRPCPARRISVIRERGENGAPDVIEALPDGHLTLLRQGLTSLCTMWRMEDEVPADQRPVRVRATEQEKLPWLHEEKEVRIVYASD